MPLSQSHESYVISSGLNWNYKNYVVEAFLKGGILTDISYILWIKGSNANWNKSARTNCWYPFLIFNDVKRSFEFYHSINRMYGLKTIISSNRQTLFYCYVWNIIIITCKISSVFFYKQLLTTCILVRFLYVLNKDSCSLYLFF